MKDQTMSGSQDISFKETREQHEDEMIRTRKSNETKSKRCPNIVESRDFEHDSKLERRTCLEAENLS